MSNIFRGYRKSSRSVEVDVSVEIFDTVMERIRNAVSQSSVEEGGKFLGRISQRGGELLLKVESYIDSGPNLDNSASHLHPDGNYQEAMFRVVERFYPDIEHLGSWHSHHCNRLDKLSSADIEGYIKSVNNPQYNLDYFFVLLVTALLSARIQARYYLFLRGQKKYIELDEPNVRIIHGSSLVEPMLREAERTTFDYRAQSGFSRPSAPIRATVSEDDNELLDTLKRIRAEDQKWISQHYPSARALQNKNDQSICWRWSIEARREKINICYKHPKDDGNITLATGHLEIFFQGEKVVSEDIALNNLRFEQIERYINETELIVEQRLAASNKHKSQ